MNTATNAPEALLKKLRTGHRFLLTSHVNPDGDAVGSCLGLARILRSLGKGVLVWSRDPIPSQYSQLAGSSRVHTGEEPPANFPDGFDAVVALECPDLGRSGLAAQFEGLPVVNIDHHLGNEHYGEVNWVDTAAPSLGEMVYRIGQALMVDLDEETATCLYLTLVTDTGGFRFSNSTPSAFQAAAILVGEGAQPAEVSRWLYESRSESSIRLLGEMLSTLERDGRVATAVVTHEMFARTKASSGDTEGLIDYPRSIDGVDAVGIIRQIGDEEFKVSLRSRGNIDVEKIARKHGGGGHRNAAGFPSPGPLDQLRSQVARELADALD